MAKVKLRNYVDVYSYLFDKRFDNYSIVPKEGLVLGLLDWSSSTGNAQQLLNSVMPTSLSKLEKGIKKFFIDADKKEGIKWVSMAPVSLAGTFSQEYADTFNNLIKKTQSAQLKLLKMYDPLFKFYTKALNLTQENQKALLYCALLTESASYRAISHLSALPIKEAMNVLATNDFLGAFLNKAVRHIPGRALELYKEFDWLFDEEVLSV